MRVLEGLLSINATVSGDLENCPCVLPGATDYYLSTPSRLSDIYRSISSELIVESFSARSDAGWEPPAQ